VSKYGVTFASATRDERKVAQITVQIPEDADAREFAVETFGPAKLGLDEIEERVARAAAEIQEELKALQDGVVMC